MATVNEIFAYINSLAPFDTQEDWDNSGLLAGDGEAEIKQAALALDITRETVGNAVDMGARLFISHHPVIFHPTKSVLAGTPLFDLLSNGIAAICAHTCLDSASGGVNDCLAQALGFTDIEPLPLRSTKTPLVRLAHIDPVSGRELAERVRDRLGCKPCLADGKNTVTTVALCGGAGDSLADEVLAKADAFITGEVSHHNYTHAVDISKTIITAGHFETENPVMPWLCAKLQKQFPETRFNIVKQSNPVTHF